MGLFVESHTIDLGDSLDDLHLLFDGDDASTIVVRDYFDPHVHSLYDQSSHIGMIVDTYVQKFEEVSLPVDERVLEQVLQQLEQVLV